VCTHAKQSSPAKQSTIAVNESSAGCHKTLTWEKLGHSRAAIVKRQFTHCGENGTTIPCTQSNNSPTPIRKSCVMCELSCVDTPSDKRPATKRFAHTQDNTSTCNRLTAYITSKPRLLQAAQGRERDLPLPHLGCLKQRCLLVTRGVAWLVA